MRVVVRLESEIAIVAEELHRLLVVDKDVDARDERSREETPGYRGRHFDVRARPDSELPELLTVQRAEIQVRTRAADLWASLEHELRYKGGDELPAARSRQFVLAASLLELAERELEDLRAWQVDTQQHTAGAAAAPSREAAAPLDEAALAEFLATRYTAAPSTPRRLGWMLELLREMNLDSTAALTSLLPAIARPADPRPGRGSRHRGHRPDARRRAAARGAGCVHQGQQGRARRAQPATDQDPRAPAAPVGGGLSASPASACRPGSGSG